MRFGEIRTVLPRNFTLRSFPGKVARRIAGYGNRLKDELCRWPKRYFAKAVVRLLGPRVAERGVSVGSASRDRPHILILRNKYYSKGSTQCSTEEMHLDNTLSASKLATFSILTYDHDLSISPLSDLQLIAKCRDVRPDAIVLSSWSASPSHPSVDSIQYVRRQMGIPVAAIWWDTCSAAFWKALQPCKQCFDLHVVVDNPTLNFSDRGDAFFHQILQLWPPQDENLFFPAETRDIPVSFLGQAGSYRSYRQEVIDHLIGSGIPGRFSVNERKEQVSHVDYASLMRRSKISINFSYSVSCHQLKSRVFEILFSGAALFESENEQTSELFTPMRDYVPFRSKEDLVDKIRYYLDNEDELSEIAKQGRETAIKHFGSDRFWRLLLDRLGLPELHNLRQ